MELDQLEAFLTLAKTKSFSRTAEALHLVQSTVSVRIQVLEERIGRPLFIRNNRRVELTPAGDLLVPYAERVLALAQEARMKVRAQGVFEDKLTLGSTDSLWRHFLRPVLLDYCAKYPATSVETRTSHSYSVIQYLLDRVVQLAFVYHSPQLPGIEARVIFEDDIILVAGKGTPYAKLKRVERGDLANLPFINLEWDGPLNAWIKKMLPRDFLPQIQLDQLSMLGHFVVAGRGVAFVPRHTMKKPIETGEAVELKLAKDIKPPRRKIYLVYRREKQMRPAAQRWLDLLKQHKFRVR